MKVANQPFEGALAPDLEQWLGRYRTLRGFEVSRALEEKTRLLNEYFSRHRLSACVVGTSGGLDSACVLAMCMHASRQPGSPVSVVHAVFLPVFGEGATGQKAALERARESAATCGASFAIADLTDVHTQMRGAVEGALGIDGDSWAAGQLVSYLRTPALYYCTSLLLQSGVAAVVCGTTNRDEGAYLGYVGKAADGMVDVQMIADLHKSEVAALATHLDVPQSVLGARPTGDMHDGRDDTDVFGAPYDFVELYLSWLCESTEDRERLLAELDPVARPQFVQLAENLERVHGHNAHKYLVGSPAVHLDIYPSAVPGGWQ